MVAANTSTQPDAGDRLIRERRHKIKMMLSVCAHCTMCAESCFMYRTHGRGPDFTPGYKFVHSLGRIVRRKGRLSHAEWDSVSELAFRKCVLCMRCYCPLGINIPELIGLARSLCRLHGKNVTFEGQHPAGKNS